MTVETADWVGFVLAGGRYRVTAKLGAGGMGLVYRVWDQNLGCDAVIKVPRADLLEDPEFAGRFAREVRSLVQLAHPHIVKILDVGEHGGVPFLVLQFLSGGSLRDRQPSDPDGRPLPMPAANLAAWLPDVAGALDFIHQQRCVHRDVKPENILFDAHGHVFLTDFGVAKVVADRSAVQATQLTGAGMVLGTPPYMAPELLLGQACDGRVDQYALAVTVYELLSGRMPFDGKTPAAVFVQQTQQRPPALEALVSGLPRAVAEAVQKGLAKEPGQRFADCASFARAVVAALGAQPARGGAKTAAMVRPNGAQSAVAQVVNCPGCGTEVAIAPAASDEGKVRCPGCQKVLRFSQRRAGTQAAAAAPALETQRANPAKTATPPAMNKAAPPPPAMVPLAAIPIAPPGRSRLPLMIGGGVLGGALIAAGIAWAVLANRPPEQSSVPFEQAMPTAPKATEPAKSIVQPKLLRITDVNVRPGQNEKFEVRVERQGFEGPIRVQLEELPTGVLTSAAVTIPADRDAATFELFARPDAVEGGAKEVRIVADAAGRQLTGSVWVAVRTQQAFQLFVDPVVLRAGGKVPVSVRVDRQGTKGAIELGITGFPGFVAAQPASIPADKSETTLFVTAAADAKEGRTRGRIQGSTPDTRADAGFELEIRMLETIRLEPIAPVTIRSGKVREITVDVERSGYNGAIKLRVEGSLPQGLKVAKPEEIKPFEKRGLLQLEGDTTLRDGAVELKIVAVGDKDVTAETPLKLATRQLVVQGETYRLLDAKPGNSVWEVAFSDDGRKAAAATELSQIRVWELGHPLEQTRELDQPFKGLPLRFKTVSFYPSNSNWLLAGVSDGTIRRWEFPKNAVTGGRILGLHEPVKGIPTRIDTVVFAPGGKAFMSLGTDRTLRAWKADVEKRDMVGTPGAFAAVASPRALAFLPNGKEILIASLQEVGLLDLTQARPIRILMGHKPVPPPGVPVNAVAVSPDGKLGLTGGSDGTARLWDLGSGDLVQTLTGHSDWVTSVAFAPNGQWAVSASMDRTIRIWDVATGEELRRCTGHALGVITLAIAADGSQILSGSYDGTVRLWAVVK